jgi:hypothetical protein
MDDAVLSHLRSALATHTPEVYEEPSLTRNLLKDLCGPDKFRGEIWVLAGAVTVGVPQELADVRTGGPSPLLGDRLVHKLRLNLGMDQETARWAVVAWASVLGITGLQLTASSRRPQSPGPNARPGVGDAQRRQAGLIRRAKEIATALPPAGAKAVALGLAATALADTDASQAMILLDEAELLVQSAASQDAKTRQWRDLSAVVASTDPDRAERMARSLPGPIRDHAIECLARALADTDLDRALRLAWSSIEDENLRMYALTGLAASMTQAEPDRAARLARTLTAGYWTAEALCRVATRLAAADPDGAAALLTEAESIARSARDGAGQAAALSSVARALADVRPEDAARLFDEAEALARSLSGEQTRTVALGSLAVSLAVFDTDRALSLTRSLADNWYAVGEIARLTAHRDPSRALAIAQSITSQTPHLADIAVALSVGDPDCAQRLAWSINTERWRAAALTGIARKLNATDPDRAARLLEEVERSVDGMPSPLDQVIALVEMATAWAEK